MDYAEYLKDYMQKKFIEGYEGHEIVICLLALIKEGKIKEKDLLPILSHVYMGNNIGIYNALNKAKALVDDDLIDDILKEVKNDR